MCPALSPSSSYVALSATFLASAQGEGVLLCYTGIDNRLVGADKRDEFSDIINPKPLGLVFLPLVGQWTVPGNLVRLNGFSNPSISYMTDERRCFTYSTPDQIPGLEHVTKTPHIKNVTSGHTAQNAEFSMLMQYLDGP